MALRNAVADIVIDLVINANIGKKQENTEVY